MLTVKYECIINLHIFLKSKVFVLAPAPDSSGTHISFGGFHHLLYNICISPFSCKSKIAKDIWSFHGEPVIIHTGARLYAL